MNIKALLIERFARWLIGGVPFAGLKRLVREWDDADRPGCRVNLGLELAVAWLQSKTGKSYN